MPDKREPSMDFGPTTQQFDSVTPSDALPAGTRLGGYQIIDVLGRGGFGIVYLALDSSLQRQVAIKEYFPAELAMRCNDGQVWVKPGADTAAYGSGMKAFLDEAKMLARFDHPSLARVHSFWEENRSAYMAMPYYEGRSLAEVLAAMPRPPDEAWLRTLLSPLLNALSTLHNEHCLHLDISPDNIILLADNRPVLLDFGVASRMATDKTLPLTALLNPAYAPIEQYSESASLQQGPWSDLYALASVLHFAIAGAPPARATVRAVDDPQRPMAETVAERARQFPGLAYSASFLAAIDKALAVRPRDRPRSTAEFQALLDRSALQGASQPAQQQPSPQPKPVAPPPPNVPGTAAPGAADWLAAEPMDAPRRPARRRATAWIASLAVLGFAAAGWMWLQRQPSFADITAADLPPSVVASLPTLPADAASAAAPPSSAVQVDTDAPSDTSADPAVVQAVPATSTTSASGIGTAVTTAASVPPPASAQAPSESPQALANTARDKPAPSSTPAAPPEPATPRLACGNRSNFALVYCMQQQCKRTKFSTHAECVEFERRGEL